MKGSIVILLNFLLLVDVLILSACVALAVCYGTLPPEKITVNRLTLLYIIIMLGAYGALSMLCNCFATYGVKNHIKTFLVPYLIFYPLIFTLTIILLTFSPVSYPTSVGYLIGSALFIITLLWLRFVRCWNAMANTIARSRGDSLEIVETGETVWSQVILDTPSRDQPPAYDSPPGYEEAVRAASRCQEKETK